MISNIRIVDVSAGQTIIKQAIDENNNVLGTLKADNATRKIYSGTRFSSFYTDKMLGNSTIANPHIYVSDLVVNSNVRKQGIGRKLIHAIVRESEKLGLGGRVILLAGSNEGSPLPFYKKLGFVTDDRKLNIQLDDYLKYRKPFDTTRQIFMSLPKKVIAQILKSLPV